MRALRTRDCALKDTAGQTHMSRRISSLYTVSFRTLSALTDNESVL